MIILKKYLNTLEGLATKFNKEYKGLGFYVKVVEHTHSVGIGMDFHYAEIEIYSDSYKLLAVLDLTDINLTCTKHYNKLSTTSKIDFTIAIGILMSMVKGNTKHYYYVLKLDEDMEDITSKVVLNYNKKKRRFFLSNRVETKSYQTKFTPNELKRLIGDKKINLDRFYMEECNDEHI